MRQHPPRVGRQPPVLVTCASLDAVANFKICTATPQPLYTWADGPWGRTTSPFYETQRVRPEGAWSAGAYECDTSVSASDWTWEKTGRMAFRGPASGA